MFCISVYNSYIGVYYILYFSTELFKVVIFQIFWPSQVCKWKLPLSNCNPVQPSDLSNKH